MRTAALQATVDLLASLDTLSDSAKEVEGKSQETGKSLKDKITESVRKFNQKPKHGVKMLEEYCLVQKGDSASMVSFIIKQHANLEKEALGSFISEADSFNNDCLDLFTDSLSF